MKEENPWRYRLLGFGFAIAGLIILGQLIRIQLIPQAELIREWGHLFAGEWRTITPSRGLIYDRKGEPLATNQIVYEIGVEIRDIQNPHTIASAISAVTDAGYEDVLRVVENAKTNGAIYVIVADFVPHDKVVQLKDLAENIHKYFDQSGNLQTASLQGLVFRPHLYRSYPEESIGSNILGFVTREMRGYFGVEEYYNDLLAGQPRDVWVPLDPHKVELPPEIQSGADLILTLDWDIQMEVERILDRSVKQSGSEAGTIVVTNPSTGEILAMASTHRLNLNEYWNYNKLFVDDLPFNSAHSKTYEPGSIFKILTMATALDVGAVKPTTVFLDTGAFRIGGITIRNWDWGAWGPQDMTGCLQHSLNVCLAWVASEVGPADYYRYMQEFGIGHQSGVDLAGERSGRLKVPGDEDWYLADLGTNSFGQGVAVNPIQFVMAAGAIANDGEMMVPHVLKSMVNNGRQYNPTPQIAGVPIRKKTARTLTDMLVESLEREASSALVEGYKIAGKTGTAEIPTEYGYTSQETNASFVGWGPVDDPRFLVFIWLEKPSSSPWGSVVAAPVFHDVVERLVVLMDLPPDHVRHKLAQK